MRRAEVTDLATGQPGWRRGLVYLSVGGEDPEFAWDEWSVWLGRGRGREKGTVVSSARLGRRWQREWRGRASSVPKARRGRPRAMGCGRAWCLMLGAWCLVLGWTWVCMPRRKCCIPCIHADMEVHVVVGHGRGRRRYLHALSQYWLASSSRASTDAAGCPASRLSDGIGYWQSRCRSRRSLPALLALSFFLSFLASQPSLLPPRAPILSLFIPSSPRRMCMSLHLLVILLARSNAQPAAAAACFDDTPSPPQALGRQSA